MFDRAAADFTEPWRLLSLGRIFCSENPSQPTDWCGRPVPDPGNPEDTKLPYPFEGLQHGVFGVLDVVQIAYAETEWNNGTQIGCVEKGCWEAVLLLCPFLRKHAEEPLPDGFIYGT